MLLWTVVAVHSHLAFVAEVDIEDVRIIKAFSGTSVLLEVLNYLGERTGGGRAA